MVVVVCVCVCCFADSVAIICSRKKNIYIFYNLNRNIPFPGTSSSQSGCDVLPV